MPENNNTQLICASHSIIVKKKHQSVFTFFSDMRNDPLWRREINATFMSDSPRLNALVLEDSFLSGRTPSHILHLECIEYDEYSKVVYQTRPESLLYLKSIREVEAMSPDITKVTYSISFDKGIVKKGVGFNLPSALVRYIAQRDMIRYLKKMKAILEKRSYRNITGGELIQ